MIFSRAELDDIEGSEQYQDNLMVTLDCEEVENPVVLIAPWVKYQKTNPNIIFSSKLEADETMDSFVPKHDESSRKPLPPKHSPSRSPPASSPKTTKKVEINETNDLLNLNSSPIQPVTTSSSTVQTDDLLKLGSDPVLANKDEPCMNKLSNPLFEPFSSCNHLFQQPSNGDKEDTSTANLLDEWGVMNPTNISNSNSSFTHFNPTTIPNLQNLNLSDNATPSETSSQHLGGFPNMSNIQRNVSSPNLHSDIFEEFVKPKAMSSANSPAKTSSEANYSRSHFESAKPPQTQTAATGKKNEDVFGDLLGSQGYSFTPKKDSGPLTINQMRREDKAKVTDPDKLKVRDWCESKTTNLRALLTTLHTVLWTDAKWHKCYMHQLVSPADVKRFYRKACIAVHPDKHIGTPNEMLAKLIFMELNIAWNEFKKELA